ncbi:MAG TPA: hypothetical protein PK177_12305 [Burkholderiaceae bacterium]|nr:hypothetical protein [Burkholderiaceae bacterium]
MVACTGLRVVVPLPAIDMTCAVKVAVSHDLRQCAAVRVICAARDIGHRTPQGEQRGDEHQKQDSSGLQRLHAARKRMDLFPV